MSSYDTYSSPLASRNASEAMLRLWSPRHKFNTWRRIWLAVAEAQHELTSERARSASEGSSPSSSSPPSLAGASGSSIRELVTREQVEELRAVVNRPGGITDEEMKVAEKYERELRHDVMAHVHTLGDSCPKAKGIIHLGMTSQDVVCNADLMTIEASLELLDTKVSAAILALGSLGAKHLRVPTLGFTHYQPAQPLTVGRRAAQWASELGVSWDDRRTFFDLRGIRGATGTQASFLALLNGNHELVDRLDAEVVHRLTYGGSYWESALLSHQKEIARLARCIEMWQSHGHTKNLERDVSRREALMGMTAGQIDARHTDFLRAQTFSLTTQTYPRVVDTIILSQLASTAAVLHKIATDIRLLCNRKELDEPFEDKQIGSSAMPYKRNPMRCERICGLTRFVMNLVGNAYDTAATQWLERTLDDSSNRRLSLPEAFLALDGALDLMHNVASGLVVHEAMVRKNLMAELPFMATENILMECVKLGGDRQHYHELIRVHAQAAGHRVKHEGLDNDLLECLKNDKAFWSKARGGQLTAELNWDGLMDPMKYVGRSVEQTERFIKEVVEPLREQYGEAIEKLGQSGPKV
jgi:adenylosuccinate lyase